MQKNNEIVLENDKYKINDIVYILDGKYQGCFIKITKITKNLYDGTMMIKINEILQKNNNSNLSFNRTISHPTNYNNSKNIYKKGQYIYISKGTYCGWIIKIMGKKDEYYEAQKIFNIAKCKLMPNVLLNNVKDKQNNVFIYDNLPYNIKFNNSVFQDENNESNFSNKSFRSINQLSRVIKKKEQLRLTNPRIVYQDENDENYKPRVSKESLRLVNPRIVYQDEKSKPKVIKKEQLRLTNPSGLSKKNKQKYYSNKPYKRVFINGYPRLVQSN